MQAIDTIPVSNHFRIVENSVVLKFLTLIPGIGLITGLFIESSLKGKFDNLGNPDVNSTDLKDRAIKYLSIKNHYKIASIISNMLMVAAATTGLVFTILADVPSAAVALGTTALVCAILIPFDCYNIYKNKCLINQIKEKENLSPQDFYSFKIY